MFGSQNMAMPLLPGGAQPNIFCGLGYYSWCGYGYYTTGCGYYISGCVYYPHTHLTCIFATCGIPSIREQVQQFVARDPFDQVETLQVLRRQLEVALAGVRAEEEELRRQRAAAGGEGSPQGRGARGGT